MVPLDTILTAVAFTVAALAGALAGRRDRVPAGATLFDMLVAGLVAARLAFVAQWFGVYGMDPWAMVDIRDGGFTPWAGIMAALALAAWKGRRVAALRRPLAIGVACGAIAWGLLAALPRPGGANAPSLPSLALERLEGGTTSIAAIGHGTPTVVNLWATWCPPCRREMPILARAQRDESGVRFVFADQGEDAAAVRRYLEATVPGISNVLLDSQSDLGRELDAPGLPTTLFFDAAGRLVDTHVGALSSASLAAKLVARRGSTTP